MKKNLFIATSIFFILIISSVSAISWSGGGVLVQGNITNISQLDDVDVSGVEDDDVLRWNDAVKKWVASKLNSILSFGDDYLFFSGDNEITFNETKLNETGDLRYVNIDGDTMTGNLNMGNNSLENVNTIYMNITGNDNGVIEGEITWNSNDHTLNLDSGLGPVNQVGYENWILVVNNEGVEIKDSQAVYFCGTQGNRPAVCLARADITLTSMVIGVATMDIPINQEGIITWAGVINNIDTSMFADNATFYLSATEAGNWTTTAPLAPNFPIQLGIITNSHAMQGSALIQIGPTDVTDGMVINSLTINENFAVNGNTSFDGFLNMNTNNITNLGDLQSERGSLITRGVNSIFAVSGNIFSGLGNAFILYNNGTLEAGDRGFGFLQNGKILLSLTTGGPSAAGYWRNSMIIGTDQGSTNASFLNNGLLYVVGLGIIPRVDFNTTQTGSDLFVQDDIQINGTYFSESGIEARGKFTFIGSGNDNTADFINTRLHPQELVNFTSGFELGENRKALNVPFLGTISPFKNLDVNPFIWFIDTSALCKDDACAHVDGSSGSSDITMITNTSTLNLNETELSFTDSLVNLIGADNFRVETNNFSGTGWEIQFTDSGSVVTEFNSITLGVDYWNISTVGVKFVCDVSQLGRSCFVDNVILNGTQTVASNENVTGIRSQYCGGTGQVDPITGLCDRAIYYNPETDQWTAIGTVNWTTGGGAGSGIVGTANRIAKITSDGTTAGNSNLNDDGSTITSDVPVVVTGDVNSTGFFNGLFNWTVLTNWLSFDGATLSFNETKLNETIDARSIWETDGENISYSNGNVGIGTASPSVKFEINDTITNPTDVVFRVSSGIENITTELYARGTQSWNVANLAGEFRGKIQYSTPGDEPGIIFRNTTDGGRSQIKQFTPLGGLSFGANVNSNNPGDQMVFTTDGFLGIGTKTPTQVLEVNGSVNISGFYYGDGSKLTGIASGGDFSFSDFQGSFNSNFSGKTTDDLTEGSTNLYDNETWNEALADTLYLGIADQRFNETDLINTETSERIGNDTQIRTDYVSADNGNRTQIETLITQEETSRIGNDTLKANLVGGNSFTGQQDFNGGWTSGGVSIIDGNIFAQTGFFYNLSAIGVDSFRINGSLYPQDGFDDTFEIGNSTRRWNSISIGTGVSSFAGDVGIGTTSPNSNLHIIGGLCLENTDSGCTVPASQMEIKSSVDSQNPGILLTNEDGQTNFIYTGRGTGSSPAGDLVLQSLDGSGDLFISGLDVGIGTASPGAKLDVVGTGRFSSDLTLDGGFKAITTAQSTLDWHIGPASGIATMNLFPNPLDGTSAARIQFFRNTNTVGAKDFNIYKGDNTGSVRHQFGSNNVIFNNLLEDIDTIFRGSSDSNLLFVNAGTNTVGIGTTSPGAKLEVVGTGSLFKIQGSESSVLTVADNADNELGIILQARGAGQRADITRFDDRLQITVTTNTGNPPDTNGISILNNGDVGIGTTTPTHKLNVIGDVNVTGDFIKPRQVIWCDGNQVTEDTGTECCSIYTQSTCNTIEKQGVLISCALTQPSEIFLAFCD